jgi:hypothetical protein
MKKTIIAAVLLAFSATAFASPPHRGGYAIDHLPPQGHHHHRNRDRLWQGIAIGVVGGILINESQRRREPEPPVYVEYTPPPRLVRECYVDVTYDRWGQRTETRTCYDRPVP